MNVRAATKNTTYLSKARSVGADFSLLVVETHGRFHNSFLTLLKRLAGQLNGQAEDTRASQQRKWQHRSTSIWSKAMPSRSQSDQ